ncbi:MAG: hypothetical protein ACTSRS_13120 [Candidatus Helarchaeota archaeon]
MAPTGQIWLKWYQEEASVLEQVKGHTYQVGVVTLKFLAETLIGFTYYHFLLATFESVGVPIEGYDRYLAGYQRKYRQIRQQVRKVQKTHPEISESGLLFDNEEAPQFIGIRIPVTFEVPVAAVAPGTLAFKKVEGYITQKIIQYIGILGALHELEICNELQERGDVVEMARNRESF